VNKLLRTIDQFMWESGWKELGLVKLCSMAAGVIAGVCLPKKAKMPALFASAAVFAATYVPLMVRFFRVASGKTRPR